MVRSITSSESLKIKMKVRRKHTKRSRPTYMSNTTVEEPDWQRLYELIWKRTMASQMADAELEKTIAKIAISTNKEELTAIG